MWKVHCARHFSKYVDHARQSEILTTFKPTRMFYYGGTQSALRHFNNGKCHVDASVLRLLILAATIIQPVSLYGTMCCFTSL